MSQLGRIGGQVLTDNLLRAGVDLAFETDLLYLKVSPVQSGVSLNEDSDPNFGKAGSTSTPSTAIGINTDVPIYDFDVRDLIVTNNLTVLTQLSVDNIVVNSPRTFTTSVGGINIFIAGSDIYHDRLITANLEVNDNYISSFSNSNITLDPAGTGTVEFLANTNIAGDLTVGTTLAPRNINISGDLSKQGSLILGDQIIDTVTVNTDFAQSIIPGDDLVWSIGENTGDSSPRRWAELISPDWTNITTGAWPGSGLRPQSMTVSDQMSLDGSINKISAIQSNEDILLNPNTGVVYVESVKFGEIQWINPITLNNPNAYSTIADDEFGNSVAISNIYAIVGVYGEDDAGGSLSGKAYIYNAVTGSLLYTLNNPNAYSTSSFDYFGWSVSISDTRAIVGAFFEDDAGGLDSGKAYIYNPATGSLLFTLNNPNPVGTSANDYFGYSVSISDTYAIVGAHQENASGVVLDAGKAYIYNAATGALLHTLNNPNAYGTGSFDYFGWSVAVSNSRAIVGAYGEDDVNGTTSGKAYIYNAATGALLYTLNNPNPIGTSTGDNFGYSVAISNAYAIVGAYGEDGQSGKAYIYSVATGALLHTLTNPNAYGTTPTDRFGWSVSISDTYAVVGAYLEDDAGGIESGKAYIFDVLTGALLQILNNPNAYNTSVGDQFGYSVAISGSQVIVGTPYEDGAGGTQSGKSYIFSSSINQSAIKNLLNTPLTLGSTGIGYTLFAGDNAMIIPSGNNSERRPSPEVGETRWNTEEAYLECFDGTVWAVSTGGGEEVTSEIMNELSNVYALVLG
jgi:hypothetical protein